MQHIRVLGLGDCGMSDSAMAVLATSLRLKNDSLVPLTRLQLGKNKITETGAEMLARAFTDTDVPGSTLPRLHLGLGNNQLGDIGAKWMAGLISSGQVRVLRLNANL